MNLQIWLCLLSTRLRQVYSQTFSYSSAVAAQLPPSGTPDDTVPVTLDNVEYFEDGGDPIYLDGNVYLCARTDGDAQRFFSGSVAQAGFYDEALNASSIEVRQLFTCWDAGTARKLLLRS